MLRSKIGLYPVQFTKGYTPYHAGEIAGFDKKKSQLLIDKSYAVAYPPADDKKQDKKTDTKPANSKKDKQTKSSKDKQSRGKQDK